ncbi:hypothetical protein [Bacillus anthracis]|uniref:hypothetical protein n=1 Tax=Bacillus anthracis TaxID=1392 RepID=UPI0001DBF610|nr:hypothetical protein [Bacillus cereus]ADK08366.1 hypothetical GntR-type regulatory protein [Bacillus cereus biovar anthracis str. CI]
MEQTNQDLNKLTKLEYDKVPKFMRGAIGKKYGFNSLSRDIVGFLRNRMSVSVKNGWKEDGRYYVKASSKEMCDEFVTTNKTLDKALKIVEDIGYISSKKGFNSSKKFFIDFEIEARLNEEYLQWKEENKSVGMHTDKLTKSDSLGESTKLANNESECLNINSLGNIPILNETSNDNSLGNSPNQFRKNSYLERSTLERRTKDIKTYTDVLEFVNICRRDFVHLKTMDEQELQGHAEKWYEAYDPEKEASIKTWIRACAEDLNESIEDPLHTSDVFTERFYEDLEKKESIQENESPKVEKIQTPVGYVDVSVVDDIHNPFLDEEYLAMVDNTPIQDSVHEVLEEINTITLDEEVKPVTSKSDKPKGSNLTYDDLERLAKLVKQANSGDQDAIMKCNSDRMEKYVGMNEFGFEIRSELYSLAAV